VPDAGRDRALRGVVRQAPAGGCSEAGEAWSGCRVACGCDEPGLPSPETGMEVAFHRTGWRAWRSTGRRPDSMILSANDCAGLWASPPTWHQAPGTRHQAPGTRHQAPGTRHQAPGTRHQAPGTRHQAPGTRYRRRTASGGTVGLRVAQHIAGPGQAGQAGQAHPAGPAVWQSSLVVVTCAPDEPRCPESSRVAHYWGEHRRPLDARTAGAAMAGAGLAHLDRSAAPGPAPAHGVGERPALPVDLGGLVPGRPKTR
jgi:hypothetical protein